MGAVLTFVSATRWPLKQHLALHNLAGVGVNVDTGGGHKPAFQKVESILRGVQNLPFVFCVPGGRDRELASEGLGGVPN